MGWPVSFNFLRNGIVRFLGVLFVCVFSVV